MALIDANTLDFNGLGLFIASLVASYVQWRSSCCVSRFVIENGKRLATVTRHYDRCYVWWIWVHKVARRPARCIPETSARSRLAEWYSMSKAGGKRQSTTEATRCDGHRLQMSPVPLWCGVPDVGPSRCKSTGCGDCRSRACTVSLPPATLLASERLLQMIIRTHSLCLFGLFHSPDQLQVSSHNIMWFWRIDWTWLNIQFRWA